MPSKETFLTTEEAKALIDMLKQSVVERIEFPQKGIRKEFDLAGTTKRDAFVVSIYRGRRSVRKINFGGWAKAASVSLLELHITQTQKHRNPDGTIIVGSHLHIYTQEHERAYAIPFDIHREDLTEYCMDFFERFNVVKRPTIFKMVELGDNDD